MPQPVIDCDLSRAFLDLSDLPFGRTQRIPNTCDAVAEWVETLAPDILVVFEATSGYDDILIAMRDSMRTKGKALKTILIAVVRQLLVILNAMIQKRQPLQIT